MWRRVVLSLVFYSNKRRWWWWHQYPAFYICLVSIWDIRSFSINMLPFVDFCRATAWIIRWTNGPTWDLPVTGSQPLPTSSTFSSDQQQQQSSSKQLLSVQWPESCIFWFRLGRFPLFFLFVLKSKFLSLLDLILEEAACIFLFFVLFRFLFCSLYFCGLAFNCFYLWRHNDILQILWLYKSWVLCKLVHYTARCVVFGQLVRWVCI